jgi:hypothetical protein
MKDKLLKIAIDLGETTGLAVFVYGLWLAWHPLGIIIGGLILALICILVGYGRYRREAIERLRDRGGRQ